MRPFHNPAFLTLDNWAPELIDQVTAGLQGRSGPDKKIFAPDRNRTEISQSPSP